MQLETKLEAAQQEVDSAVLEKKRVSEDVDEVSLPVSVVSRDLVATTEVVSGHCGVLALLSLRYRSVCKNVKPNRSVWMCLTHLL